MKLFFYVKFTPVTNEPGMFHSELLGFSSDPFMAMADLQRMGEDLIPHDSNAICILYQASATTTDLARLAELVPAGFPAAENSVSAIGILNKDDLFFSTPMITNLINSS